MADRYITINADGETRTHAFGDPGGNYATLCGLSSDDDMNHIVPTPKGQRINCPSCFGVFQLAHGFKRSDFTKELSP